MNTIKKLNEILKTDGKLRLILSGMAVDGMLLMAVVIVLGAAMTV